MSINGFHPLACVIASIMLANSPSVKAAKSMYFKAAADGTWMLHPMFHIAVLEANMLLIKEERAAAERLALTN